MAWDVTHPDTYAAVNQAAANKIAKYDELASTHIFYPGAIETGGTWNHWTVELVQEIVRRVTLITGEPRQSIFFYFSSCQWPSNGEMRSPSSTLLTPIRRRCNHTLLSKCYACSFMLVGETIIIK